MLTGNAAQLRALAYLDRLQAQLHSRPGPADRGWLRRWFGAAPEPVRGGYLWGGVGAGKSLLMDLFHASLAPGLSERVHFHRFMRAIHARKTALGQVQEPLQIIAREIAAAARVLCLDEFIVTDITDAMLLAGLLRGLFANGCALVTTSNTPVAELYRDGLQRARFLPAIALLERHTAQIHVDPGQDYRMRCLRQDGIYHTPADQQARQRMAATFSQLSCAGQSASAVMININDREIQAFKAGPGVLWFAFDALCRTRRSSHDYIEIARQCHTVLLSDLPQMAERDNDAARRFIELVDEFYDRHVNLIVSSDFPPDALYTGKRLAQPFQRTASRLVEMRSAQYLGKPHLSQPAAPPG